MAINIADKLHAATEDGILADMNEIGNPETGKTLNQTLEHMQEEIEEGMPQDYAKEEQVKDGNDTVIAVTKAVKTQVGTSEDLDSASTIWGKIKAIWTYLTGNTNGLAAIKTAVDAIPTTTPATPTNVTEARDAVINAIPAVPTVQQIQSGLATGQNITDFRQGLMGSTTGVPHLLPLPSAIGFTTTPPADPDEATVVEILQQESASVFKWQWAQSSNWDLLVPKSSFIAGTHYYFPFGASIGADALQSLTGLIKFYVPTQAPDFANFFVLDQESGDYIPNTGNTGFAMIEVTQNKLITCVKRVDYYVVNNVSTKYDQGAEVPAGATYQGSVYVYSDATNNAEITLPNMMNYILEIENVLKDKVNGLAGVVTKADNAATKATTAANSATGAAQSASSAAAQAAQAIAAIGQLQGETEILSLPSQARINIITPASQSGAVNDFPIEANVMYSFGDLTALSLIMQEPSDLTAYNEFMVCFFCQTGFTLSVQHWDDPTTEVLFAHNPVCEAGHYYMLSIVNNMAYLGKF